ncbi:MAG: hypothetical protein IPI03_14510 [Rubrivivax sp.]|jgi:hypothetical protein|nr:hypothetical protein [Rubrivivax sp.]MBK7263007.1 hypothetical protein [Rubrivivax sp.]MBK8529182.1 hypothetical protein [Rubrivivax sp.]
MTATLHQALDAAHALADGGFMACRWGLTRHLSTLEEVALFCVQVGV